MSTREVSTSPRSSEQLPSSSVHLISLSPPIKTFNWNISKNSKIFQKRCTHTPHIFKDIVCNAELPCSIQWSEEAINSYVLNCNPMIASISFLWKHQLNCWGWVDLNEWGRRDRFKISDPSGAIFYNLTNKSLISVVTSPKFSSFLDLPHREQWEVQIMDKHFW